MSEPLSREEWAERARSAEFRTQAFIGGRFVSARSGETMACINPATGEKIADVAACGAQDADDAVAAARTAFEDGRWSRLAPAKRKRVLLKFADLVRKHREELALLESLDMGKPVRDALNIDMPFVANCIAWYAEAIDKIYDEIAPTDPSAVAMITREPLGVVAAVTPWNFPLLMASWKFAPALAAGNSVILKPAEQSSLSALRVVELAAEAGIPDGVFNVLPGLGEQVGQALGRHMDVDCLTFTGSTEVGKMFMRYSGESNLKHVSLECGGKSPHIVFADCPDLDRAAKAAAFGIFFNQGEVCNAGSRLLVDAAIKDEFMDRLVKMAERMQPGDPLDPKCRMGAIVDEVQLGRVESYVAAGQEAGARLLAGGSRAVVDGNKGYFFQPTIFDKVDNAMKIAQEEIFGPVLSVLSFQDNEEALRIANDTIYGLAAGVWTRDIDTAHRMARSLKAGTVWVNAYDAQDMTTPFGGYKQSGFGRDRSLHALEKYTQLKTTWIQLSG